MKNKSGIYIHIPFCKEKCYYCDFLSFKEKEPYFEKYKDMLINEINNSIYLSNSEIKSIFIGGGTPSIIPKVYIYEILNTLYKKFKIEKNAEITIEVNPGTVDIDKILFYKKIGINRISIGLQAWQNSLLKKIGRIHNLNDFVSNYNNIRSAGFENVNVDLMFSLPSQTIEQWEETIENIILLKPEHISAYSLIVEESTPIYDMYKKNKYIQTSDEDDRNMYYKACDKLKNAGYKHYEISNFALDGFECRHNIIYWKREDYIGFGVSAHSFINNLRFNNTYNLTQYLNGNNKIQKEYINDFDAYAEFMFLGLRMIDGISIKKFEENFNKSIFEVYGTQLKKLHKNKLININKDYIMLTKKGIDLSNMVFIEFLPSD